MVFSFYFLSYWFNRACYGVPVDAVLFFHICFIIIGILIIPLLGGFRIRPAIGVVLWLWSVAILGLGWATDRVVSTGICIEVVSLPKLSCNLWVGSRGRILLIQNDPSEIDLATAVTIFHNNGPLNLYEFGKLFEASLKRPCEVSYRYQYLDFFFRPNGVLLRI